MRVIIEQIDKLLLNKAELKKEYSTGTQYIRPEKGYDHEIFSALGTFSDKKPDRATVLNNKYRECCAVITAASLSEVRQCVSRMIVLAQVFDHAGANLWFGEFCETVLDNYENAAYWFRRAASLGNGTGMYRYGMLLLDRKIQKPGAVSVKRCFTDAESKGIVEARTVLERRLKEIEMVDAGEIVPCEMILDKLCADGLEKGLINSASIEHPLDEKIRLLATNIGVELMEIFYTEENLAAHSEKEIISGALFESFYSGYAAMSLWSDGVDIGTSSELLKTLCDPYGADRMDEYVMDRFGPGNESASSKKLIEYLCQPILTIQTAMYSLSDDNTFNEQFVHATEALFDYGAYVRQSDSL